jgi:acyl transferase domain-containing protein
MVAIETDLIETGITAADHLEPFRLQNPDVQLEIACYNGPNNYVVAGRTTDIDRLESYLSDKKSSGEKLRFKVLRGMHAYHSAMADPIVEASASLSASIPFQVSTALFKMISRSVFRLNSSLDLHPLTMVLDPGSNLPIRILPQGRMDWPRG